MREGAVWRKGWHGNVCVEVCLCLGGGGPTETPCWDLITVICMCHALKEKRKCSNQTIIGGSRQKQNRGWLTVLSLSHNIRI